MAVQSLSRFQMTIGHMLAGILVFALALAPVVFAWRSPDPNMMVAAVAFDVIMLPVIVALIVMRFMPPGMTRNWVIAGLCAAPFLVMMVAGAIMTLAAPIAMIWVMIVERSPRILLQSPVMITCLPMAFTYWNQYRSSRAKQCITCGGRRFAVEFVIDPAKRMSLPSGFQSCKKCGRKIRIERGWFGNYRVEHVNPKDPIQITVATEPRR